MQLVDDMCYYTSAKEKAKEREKGDYIVTKGYKQEKHSGHSKFSNIRTENTGTEGGEEEINTTFAVQFIKGHCTWVSGRVTDVKFNDDLFDVVPLYFDKKVSETGNIM